MNICKGRIKGKAITTASTGAGATSVNLRPSEQGTIWRVIWCTGQQDDGAVAQQWYWTDPENAAGISLCAITGAANTPWPFLALDDVPGTSLPTNFDGGLFVTYDRYLSFVFTASAGSKNGLIKALVEEQMGQLGAHG